MAAKPTIIGANEVVNWYTAIHATPWWSVWDKSEKLFDYSGDDDEKSLALLHDQLVMCEQTGYSSLLRLRLHPGKSKNGFLDKDSPFNLNVPFILDVDNETQSIGAPSYGNQDIYKVGKVDRLLSGLNDIKGLLTAQESRIAALESEGLLDGPPEVDNSFMGVMMGLVKEPQKLQALIGVVHSVIKMANGQTPMAGMAGAGNPAAASPGNAGQTDDQLLNDAVRRLKAKDATLGADMQILANIAEKHADVFEQTLQGLRQWG